VPQNQAPVAHPKINILVGIDIDEKFAACRLCDKRVWGKKSDVVAYSVHMKFF